MKGYGVLSFARNMGRNIGKNITKNLNSKYDQKLLYHVKQSATDALKTALIRAIQKTAEAIGHLICNKIADRITIVSKTLQKKNSETNEREILLNGIKVHFFLKKTLIKSTCAVMIRIIIAFANQISQ